MRIDPSGCVGHLYAPSMLPAVFVIDRASVIRVARVGVKLTVSWNSSGERAGRAMTGAAPAARTSLSSGTVAQAGRRNEAAGFRRRHGRGP